MWSWPSPEMMKFLFVLLTHSLACLLFTSVARISSGNQVRFYRYYVHFFNRPTIRSSLNWLSVPLCCKKVYERFSLKLNTSCAESRPLSNSNCRGTTSVPCKGSQVDVLYRKKAHARYFSCLSTLAWLRLLPMKCVGHSVWRYKLYLHPKHQRCTDEAQKAESGNLYTWQWLWVFMGPGNHLKTS